MNRKFDNLGRISIPKEMRDKIGLANGSEAHVELLGNKIIISNPERFDLEKYIENQMEVFKDDNSACNAYYDILSKLKEPK
ncbi:MAG: AbrB/MazE/SpoVT family DNA-binding domain-containing protein [Clostridia bacterium]|nr:AbrB/MazE/SpoVT family DNA-binding domain-containing protein [Clostridia bacterium]